MNGTLKTNGNSCIGIKELINFVPQILFSCTEPILVVN